QLRLRASDLARGPNISNLRERGFQNGDCVSVVVLAELDPSVEGSGTQDSHPVVRLRVDSLCLGRMTNAHLNASSHSRNLHGGLVEGGTLQRLGGDLQCLLEVGERADWMVEVCRALSRCAPGDRCLRCQSGGLRTRRW